LSAAEKRDLVNRFQALDGSARSFVGEIYRRARQARGRLDDDVYGVLQATLEALNQSRGVPPPLIFGVSHYQTGKVEQIRFLPTGLTQIPAGARGRFVTNHPGFLPFKNASLPAGQTRRPPRIEG
jgi:hypothetical protein